MFTFPSIIQNIPDPLRRLRAQKLWLLAQDMAGVEEDVSLQIESIEEQIGQIEERARLFEKLWKIECEEAEDPGAGSNDISCKVAKINHIERVTSDQTKQGVIHDKDNNNKIKLEHIPTRIATPSRIPGVNSDSLAAIPTRSATPSSLETCKASKIPTVSTTKTAAGSSQESNIVPPSRLPESMSFTGANNTGSKIARAKRF